MKSFIVCALEPSANLHLKEVLKTYRKEYGKFELFGIYDENLCKELNLSSKPLYSSHEFSAMGFVEVLPLIFKAKRAIKELVNLTLEREKEGGGFNAVLCIDSPAFNIPFAKALKKANSKTKRIYYILPQVWAWKKGRIPVIEEHFDVLASILPFDREFFTKSIYVGHPLLDEICEFKDNFDMQKILTKKEEEKTIAFLPGSRKSEIIRLMPIFRELATHFKGEKVLCVPPFNLNKMHLYGDLRGFKIESDTPNLLKRADFAFICSGTATLEAALVGTPFILAYKAKAVDIFIARLFVKLKHIGLANIFCDFAGKEPLNPEFLQDEVSVENLLNAYNKFAYKPFFAKVGFLKEYLGFGSAKNMAKILYEI
ncbi:lipid-A-disaccharide synthase [Campylobacter upsaliensis]|nr:lipid-A-disaccharide synthase [Campylobacter upsaliensis]EAI2894031.1 lipid-A-disaccharide synthase [Campylobacter upsaliensis]EAI4456697.1 lipid-A-disaccharide synthase [Campylobacter upsaliensis]EAI6143242.1 lipid-A-disaccharide synthase [Campylobacter upsaliensis]EAJ2438184.1 lipid-A-disaccharide synthase [Campylobacter upsaliensis]